MPKLTNYLETHLGNFLEKSRAALGSKGQIPPTTDEIQTLLDYLQSNGLDPIIVGSIAVYNQLRKISRISTDLIPPTKHLDIAIAKQEIGVTKDLDLFISRALPNIPPGWKVDRASIGVPSWISPSRGYVDFLIAGAPLAENAGIPKQIKKDPDSEKMGCPIADLQSLFELKLDSSREKDLLDLLVLAKTVGIPRNLPSLNERQRENLEYLMIVKNM